MSKRTATITLGMIELTVTGDYTKAEKGDRINPPYPAEWDVTDVMWDGKDITELYTEWLTHEQHKRVEELCIEKITL
jgi:hypothetical protein